MVANYASCAVVFLGGCLGCQNIVPACPNHLFIDHSGMGFRGCKMGDSESVNNCSPKGQSTNRR